MKESKLNTFLANYSDIALAAIVIAMVGMMIVPLPTFALDLLLSLNIATAITLLLISLYVPSALKISAFPAILLITTLFRLALNVSSTRLILLQADAGAVIDAFGQFVVAGNYVVGAVIFLILTIIQFLVIAKGSERVSEVAARFTLDAMPGKQLSIDADLRSGAINQEQARDARSEVQRESQLYGAMDGAMKFVKGDAIAGIIITTINIIAGMVVGVLQLDMSAGEAAQVYTLLTIGDGLVSQIPALLIATASGIIVTRVASSTTDSHLGSDIFSQVFAHPKALAISASLLIVLALIPGLPTAPFLVLGAVMLAVAWSVYRTTEQPREVSEVETQTKIATEESSAMFPAVSPLILDLGVEFTERLGPSGVQSLTDGVRNVRNDLFDELGVKVPSCRIRQNVETIADGQFRIMVDEVEVAAGSIPVDYQLCDATPGDLSDIGALPAEDPLTGRTISWIPDGSDTEFETWTSAEYLLRKLTATLRDHSRDFVGLQDVRHMLDQLQGTYPATIAEVTPKLLSLPELTDILKQLVAEEISIRQLKQILEILAACAKTENDTSLLVESVREGLSRYISQKYASENELAAYVVDRGIEQMVSSSVRTSDVGSYLSLPPDVTSEILQAVIDAVSDDIAAGGRPVLVTDQSVRRYIKRLTVTHYPKLTVLSFQELDPSISVDAIGRIAVGG